jgi:hypothetical protein
MAITWKKIAFADDVVSGTNMTWKIILSENVSVPPYTQYFIWCRLELIGSLTLLEGAELIIHS